MDIGAFGLTHSYSDPSVAVAKAMTSAADQYSAPEAAQWTSAAYAGLRGMTVPVDPAIIRSQAIALRSGVLADQTAIDFTNMDAPGTFGEENVNMQGSVGAVNGEYVEESAFDQAKPFLIIGGIVAGGLGLLMLLRK
jgi:hypothetical protein